MKSNEFKQLKGLDFSLKIDNKVFDRGQEIFIRFGVKNITEKPVEISFLSSLECDFVVERETDFFVARIPFAVWKYSSEVGAGDMPHKIAILPGKEKVFQAKWDQTDFNGKPVDPGQYRISAVMNSKNFKIRLRLRSETRK